ncbi:MAG: protein kinase, partial [Acidobacteriota bacterium]
MTPREEAWWRRAYDLFGDLVELDPALRSSRLAALDIEPDVRERLGRLLAAAETTGPLDHLSAAEIALGPTDRPSTMADRIGDWRLGEILGRGGMGVVFSATRQGVDFEQTAALKLLLETRLDDRAVARFEQERRILALLDHPNIARLIDGGTTVDGTPFLVLEAVDGVPIDEAVTTREATARQIADWLLDLC